MVGANMKDLLIICQYHKHPESMMQYTKSLMSNGQSIRMKMEDKVREKQIWISHAVDHLSHRIVFGYNIVHLLDFYYNAKTGESVYDRPLEYITPRGTDKGAAPSTDILPDTYLDIAKQSLNDEEIHELETALHGASVSTLDDV